jgi:hypothetical protein
MALGVWDDIDPCYYCGVPADTIDHVVPKSLLDAVRDSGEEGLIAAVSERHRRMTVPSCHECNSLAGALYHQTLDERADFVRERLARRYARILAMPDWSPSEIATLSERLQKHVIAGLLKRDLARRRLRYRSRGITEAEVDWWTTIPS